MLKWTFGFAVLLCGILACAPPAAYAGIISVGPYTPSTSAPFVVPIEVTGAIELSQFAFDLTYDPADVQVNTGCDAFAGDPFCDLSTGPITVGPFFASFSPFTLFVPGFVVLDSVSLQQVGQLTGVAGIYSGPPPAPSGDGILAYIEFVTTSTGTGTSPIAVTGVSTISGAALPEPPTWLLLFASFVVLAVAHRASIRQRLA